MAILNYLSNKNCLVIAATHDIELTQLLKNNYDNYHFCENIKENDIAFEYKIHEGPANSKNAICLLEYVKFPSEIIEAAKKNCQP